MNRFENSMHIPLALKLETFRVLLEGADLRDELSQATAALQGREQSIIAAVMQDPEVAKFVEDMKKEHGDGEAGGRTQNESVTVATILSAPAIIQLAAKILKFIGKRLPAGAEQAILPIAHKLDHFGHKLHHKLLGVVHTCLTPFTFWMKPEARQHVTHAVFLAILVYEIVHLGKFTINDIVQAKETAIQAAEKGLAAIKSSELAGLLRQIVPELRELIYGAAGE